MSPRQYREHSIDLFAEAFELCLEEARQDSAEVRLQLRLTRRARIEEAVESLECAVIAATEAKGTRP